MGSTLRAQPQAVRVAQRVERQVQHDGLPKNWVEIDGVIVLHPQGVLLGLAIGVEVQLLKVEGPRILDPVQAA